MAGAAGCFLIRQTGGRAGRVLSAPRGRLARAAPHGSPGAQERHRRPAPAGLLLNENAMDFAYDCRFLLLMQFVCDYDRKGHHGNV